VRATVPVCKRALSWRSATPDVSISHILCWMTLRISFSVSQYTCDVIVVPFAWIPPSALLACPSFVARGRLFKLFRLVWWMCAHPLHWLLSYFNIHKWNPGLIACYSCDVIEKFIAIFVVGLWKKSKPKLFSAFCAHPWAFSEPVLRKTCDSLAYLL
jgi:hypothetical protein